jgi:tripartite-type tricarboxylate transporter receptor subunit TctC
LAAGRLGRPHRPHLAAQAERGTGKPLVIDNRGGASGSIGATEAARTAPDGYTWLFAWDTEATNQTTMRLPYRVMQAFAPTTLIATGPLVMVAHQSAPWRGFQDVAAAAKQAPDTISYGTGGIGSLAHVSTVFLQQLGDFKLTHVPYRGGGPAIQAVLSGELPLLVTPIPGVIHVDWRGIGTPAGG